jgi:NAD(P)-dependent dehydrogenase (short-subunit alcohol dehydrogenase family)
MKTGSQIMIDLTGKTALVTGGTRGIGQSIGEVFMKAGAKVILTGTREDEIKRPLEKCL